MGRIQIPWTGLPRKESMRKLSIALVILAGAIGFFWLMEATKSPAFCRIPVVTAQAGDDVWGLAEKYCEGEMREVVDKIVSLNGSSQIMPGQVVLLPTK